MRTILGLIALGALLVWFIVFRSPDCASLNRDVRSSMESMTSGGTWNDVDRAIVRAQSAGCPMERDIEGVLAEQQFRAATAF